MINLTMSKIRLILLISTFCTLNAFSFELKTGDILLQPLHCFACTLIEQQEQTEFSHIGMVIIEEEEVFVIEAYSKVRLVELKEFLKKTQKKKKVLVRRFKASSENMNFWKREIIQKSKSLLNLPYDRNFLWGDEALYCSELVYKILNPIFVFNYLAPKVMLFDVNPEYWDRYFRGNTPRGELGISPEDFAKSEEFFSLGEI